MTRSRYAIQFKTALLSGVSALLCLGATGCEPSFYDPRVYDDLADDVWVNASAAPEGVGGEAYGVAMASGGQSEAGARFLVAGRLEDGFGLLTVDPTGTLDVASVDLYVVNTLSLANGWSVDPVMVGDPDSNFIVVSMSNGGVPAAPDQATVALMDSSNGQTAGLFGLPGPEFINDMAFGLTSVAGSGAGNVAVLREDKLEIIADIQDDQNTAVATCNHGVQLSLSLAVADFDVNTPGDEIAFAAGPGLQPSQVQFVSGSLVSDAAATVVAPDIAPCFDATVNRAPIATLDAPAGEVDFGVDMVVADFNGNGTPDLAVGATELGVIYVYMDVDLSVGLPTPISIDGANTAVGFGAILAAGDLYPGLGDELVVGLPDATVDGERSAGKVMVYEFSGTDFLAPVTLNDASPEADAEFGHAVTVVPFGTNREILVVGSTSEVFTYFRIRAADPDVRP